MSRKNSICFSIIGILFIISILLTILQKEESKPELIGETNMQEHEPVEELHYDLMPYQFYIKELDHKLVVYKTNETEIYMKTSIEAQVLPPEMLQQLPQGIPIQSEADLYSFLESYSS